MPEAPAGFPDSLGRRRAALAVGAAAFLAHAWVLFLPFELDDFTQIPSVGPRLGFGERYDPDPLAAYAAAGDEPPPPAEYLHRPALWLLWAGVKEISPRPLAPWVFHAVSLGLQVLAAVVLHGLLSRLVSGGAALIGGLFFAVHPAGSEAVSWVSAGGDLLVTLFGLLAARALFLPGSSAVRAPLLAGGALALAMLSKESASALVALALVAVVLRRGSWRRRLASASALLAPVAMAVGLRWQATGTFPVHYAGGLEVDLASLPRMASRIPDHLRFLAAPWLADDGGVAGPALRVILESPEHPAAWGAAASVFLFLPAAALAVGGVRALRKLAAPVLVTGALLVPALFAAPGTPGAVFSRSLHAATAALAAVVATCAAVAAAGGRRARPLLLAAVCLQAAVSVDAAVHTARVRLAAGSALRDRLAATEDALRRSGAGAGAVVIDPLPVRGGDARLGSLTPRAFLRPFREPPAEVFWFPARDEFLRHPLAAEREAPFCVLESTGAGLSETVPAGLPARRGPIALVASPVAGPDRAAWRPETPVPPRSVRTVRFELPPEVEGRVAMRFTAGSAVLERVTVREPGSVTEVWPVVLDGGFEWVTAATLDGVAVEARGAGRMPPPRLVRDLPRLEITSPTSGDVIRLGEAPVVRVAGLEGGNRVHIRAEFDLDVGGSWQPAMAYDVPPGRLRPDGPDLVWLPAPGDEARSALHESLRWENVPMLRDRFLAGSGVRFLRWRVRVERRSPDRVLILGRSAWVTFVQRLD